MPILKAKLYPLSIPFKLTFSHSEASRSVCDSYILELSDGTHKGYGELVLREYVNDPERVLKSSDEILNRISQILGTITENYTKLPPIEQLKSIVITTDWHQYDLPLLAAIEIAMLDILCAQNHTNIYSLLGLYPQRKELFYGGVLPIVSSSTLKKMLYTYRQLNIPYLRIKLSDSYTYNTEVLEECRNFMGTNFDLRVDVNCGWDLEKAALHLDLLEATGIRFVEEPLGPDRQSMIKLVDLTYSRVITYVADESAVTFSDLKTIIADRTFGMLNLRIAKNGGLLRTLELSKRAAQAGLKYQLGCHVGETGILSAVGRIAASLMENPLYIDGSFDEFILSDNITTESFTFQHSGRAALLPKMRLGYQVAENKLGEGLPLVNA